MLYFDGYRCIHLHAHVHECRGGSTRTVPCKFAVYTYIVAPRHMLCLQNIYKYLDEYYGTTTNLDKILLNFDLL
jgi:hypothetical protein